jgi:hypothetical protein
MSSYLQNPGGRVAGMRLAIAAVLCSLGTLAAAQDRPAPKWELFGGYSAFNPGTDVHGVLPGGVLPVSRSLETNPWGVGASVTYNFNRWLGMTLDASTLRNSEEAGVRRVDDAALSNLSLGPKITFRHARFSPFLEGLVGDHRLMPDSFHDIQTWGLMAGGGLDLNLSRHIALRLLRADYVFSNYRYGPAATTPTTEVRGLRLQAGLVFMFGGGKPALPPSSVCSVEPGEVFAGETVTGRASGSGFNPRRTVQYSWTGGGAKVAGADASTQIDTTGLEPGSYTVTASLSDGSKTGIASCSASFLVKRPRPPEISCSSDPGTVTTGGSAAIHSSASSPDHRRLSYSYSASAGVISGSQVTAALDTTGAQPGPAPSTMTAVLRSPLRRQPASWWKLRLRSSLQLRSRNWKSSWLSTASTSRRPGRRKKIPAAVWWRVNKRSSRPWQPVSSDISLLNRMPI